MYAVRRIFPTPCHSRFLCALLVVLCLIIHPLHGEVVLGRRTPDFDFDGRPGSRHDFKIKVKGGTTACFYQPVHREATFILNFFVLKGGDKTVDVTVSDQTDRVHYSQKSKDQGLFTMNSATNSVMSVCVDNTAFGYKLVQIGILSVVASHWEEYRKEIKDLNLVASNFTSSVKNVQDSVLTMWQSMQSARSRVLGDYYRLRDNNFYVMAWSLCQCILIVVASVTQVFVVRRLFRTPNVTPTAKPRA